MKITAIETIPFRLPPRRDFRWAGLEAGVGTFVLVRLHTDDGLVGIGDAAALPDWGGDDQQRGGETARTVQHVVRDLLQPVLLGRDPLQLPALMATCDLIVRGHSYAKTAIEMACLDLSGRAAGVPVYQLLGGLARDRVAVAHMIGLMPLDQAVEEAVAAVEEGVGALQIKGGVDPNHDVAAVKAIREAVGPEVVLRLDANQGYRTAKRALTVLARMDGALDLVEQPVEGLEAMRAVTHRSSVGVIADESCWTATDALRIATDHAADSLSIYLSKAGGLLRAQRVAAVAGAARLSCDVNGSLESGIGNAANLHMALATPEVELASVIPVTAIAEDRRLRVAGTYYDDDIVDRSFEVEAGALLPLQGAGLGVEVDEQKLNRYRIDG